MEQAIRRVAVVLNGRAGALLDRPDAADAMREAFFQAGLAPVFIAPDAGTLTERIDAAVRSGASVVAVAGGDGTVACAARAMGGHDVPLAILPSGTMNLLAKDLSLPINDPVAAIAVIGGGRTRTIDIGEVNGHVFLCASMLGLPAQLGRAREASRGSAWRIWGRMARATWRQLIRTRRLRVTLTADGRAAPVRAAALTITVNPVDRAAGHSFGRSVLDGGRFGIYILGTVGPRALLGLALRVLFGRRDRALKELLAGEIDIAADGGALHVMNDGELVLLTPPLHYRVRRSALRVLVPAE